MGCFYYSNYLPANLCTHIQRLIFLLIFGTSAIAVSAQINISGEIVGDEDGDPLVGATVVIQGTGNGAYTDDKGAFSLKTTGSYPITLYATYIGYDSIYYEVSSASQKVKIRMIKKDFTLEEVNIFSSAQQERQKNSALSVESMGINAIKETPAANFYDGLGSMKGVDLTAASIGFKVINTRGFNSSAPVRSLQIIDGVDNQAPGLNFSLGNFLGASELDVENVDLIVGASSAYYGPNAFNGVISMKTKSPFVHEGLSVMARGGERTLGEIGIRYAKAVNDRFAFKFNVYYLTVNDWVADNLAEIDQADSLRVGINNPGGYDAVNRYGDENIDPGPRTYTDLKSQQDFPGLGIIHRSGFEEKHLVDYDTENLKLAGALHYRLNEKTELIYSSNFATGTTVLQGENRFSLRDIRFMQNRLELKQDGKFFVRAYATNENAGNTYDAVRTALRMQNALLSDVDFTVQYRRYWKQNIVPKIQSIEGFPKAELLRDSQGNVVIDPATGTVTIVYDYDRANEILAANNDSIVAWHQRTRNHVERFIPKPGTPAFDSLKNDIISRSIFEGGGTRIIDRSALYHLHGEYKLTPSWAEITIGGNGRMYTPISDGSIFDDRPIVKTDTLPDGTLSRDTTIVRIRNIEYGIYGGIEKELLDKSLKLSGTVRMDKNQNFNFLFSPAASAIYRLENDNMFRFSFSSAIRNPTLSDQYLNFNVGPAILIGNINGFNDLVTVESFIDFSNGGLDRSKLEYFDVDPIRPEKVKTFEIGYRGTHFKHLYIDLGYYFSIYRDFIGYNIGILTQFSPGLGLPTKVQPYRVAANAQDVVTTQGVALGLNYFFKNGFTINGNYSWNVLNTNTDDPIIPAYNTPEHKFNIGFSGRDMEIFNIEHVGFSLNYKWVQGFQFEGSPQFTGYIPSYDMLDVQINRRFPKIKSTFKLGGSNILNNKQFQIYGGPRVGRLVYLSVTTELNKNSN